MMANGAQTRKTRCTKYLLSAWMLTAVTAAVVVGDTGKELSTKLSQAKSRMMGMQIDEAVSLYGEAKTLLEQLNSEQPDHKDLAKLQKDYDKLSVDLSKKVTQRAGRAINPMRSQLEKKLAGSDQGQIKDAREKLAEAIDKESANLEAVGGAAGESLLASARELLADADQKLGAAPAKPAESKPAKSAKSTTPTGGADAKQLYSEIQRKFRGAGSGSTPEVVKAAEEIRGLIDQLRAADPEHKKIPEFEKKVDKLVSDAYAADVREARDKIQRHVDRIEMYLERNEENERPELQKHRVQLEEVLGQHLPALQAASDEGQKLISDTKATIKAVDERIGSALSGDAMVNGWIERLDVFRRNGEKDLTSGINGAALYSEIKRRTAVAEKVWAEYQTVEFPKGRTKPLEDSEHFFQASLKEAKENMEYAISSRLAATKEQVNNIASFFEADQAWKTDSSKSPKPFSTELIDKASIAVDELAGFVPDHPEVPGLRAQLVSLKKEAADRKSANKALTLMRADKYAGSDSAELKKFAKTLVPKAHEGADVLRVTIYKPDWKEETVTEWTDSTNSALRTRTTRTLLFNVAFKDKEGVFRDFGYLNQDRRSDGSWGPTYGHLAKYRDPMLEENVAKNEPE